MSRFISQVGFALGLVVVLGGGCGERSKMKRFAIPDDWRPKGWMAPCSEDDIRAAEKELNVVFPPVYRAYLLENNAVSFGSGLVGPTEDEFDGPLPVGEFYGVDPKKPPDSHDLRARRNGYDFPKRVPAGIVKIGESVSGYHAFCMSLREQDYGAIYYWDPGLPWEEREEDNVPTMQYLTKVADDFESFWNTIRVEDPE
jgi:hypothetical protein